MTTALSQFYEALTIEEGEFPPVFAADNLGLYLRSAINEFDWYHYNFSRVPDPTPEQQEELYLFGLGVTRMIKLTLDVRAAFDAPTVMFVRQPHTSAPVLEMLHGLGMIEHGRRVAQTVEAGLCGVDRVKEDEFVFTLPAKIPDDDYYERAVSEHYKREHRRIFSQIFGSDSVRTMHKNVEKLLHDLVYVFEKHFIGYDADPLLDSYYFSVAYSEVQMADGYDSFGYSARFGGITFLKYILSLTFIVSLLLRHERFAEALVAKDPSIKLENVLTISSETSGLIRDMRDAVNHFGQDIVGYKEMAPQEAERIFEVLSVSRKSTALLDRPGSPLPLLIQCSNHDVVQCLAGAHFSPMEFLLNSLRYHYPKDYDANQRSRERSMQLAVRRVLDSGLANLKYLENIKLRHEGRILTDVDLVVLEPETGTVVFCELKHQELYGSDMHSRHTRTRRLREQVGQWLTATTNWLEVVGNDGLRNSLRLPRSFPEASIIRVVVSRHYAYPVKELIQGSDVTYATWIQFFNAMETMKQQIGEKSRIDDLVAILKRGEAPGGQQEHLPEPRSLWVIRNLRFSVLQEDAGKPA